MRELSLHILDLARNALEAGANRIALQVQEDTSADRVTITIRDNGRGMSRDDVAHATDPAYTTRPTRRWGMGLALFEATCERCGGHVRIWSAPGQGTTVAGTLLLSHLDRPPLGDMGAVVQALACEAQVVRFHYRHVVNGRSFDFDTARHQEELGDIPLTSPPVLTWIREYVNRGLADVGSRA